MPLYEYQCLPHGHRFEVRQGINDAPVKTCTVCGGEVRRVIHPVGIVFKGSGFYVTDSRSSSSASKPASGPTQESKSETAGSGASDSTSGESGTKSEKTETKAEKKESSATSQ